MTANCSAGVGPADLTPDDRLREIAAILAPGVSARQIARPTVGCPEIEE